MQTTQITLDTGSRSGIADLTDACSAFAREASAGGSGLLHVFVPHATAGLVVIELGSGSEADLMEAVERLLPHDDRWTHRHGSPGHGADHVLPLLAPPALSLPIIDGRLELGTWQSVALLDTNRDNPRRQVRLSFLPG